MPIDDAMKLWLQLFLNCSSGSVHQDQRAQCSSGNEAAQGTLPSTSRLSFARTHSILSSCAPSHNVSGKISSVVSAACKL